MKRCTSELLMEGVYDAKRDITTAKDIANIRDSAVGTGDAGGKH